jgi:hypothetical protein
LIGLALAALALFNGIASMAHGGPWMFMRVGWQALAVLAILLAALRELR